MAKPDSSQLPVVGVTRLPFAPNVVVRLMRNVVTADIAREKRRGLQIDEPSVTNPAPPGQTYGKPRLTPSAADVVGPESEVRRVARLVVYIATEAGNVRTEVPIRALDGRGVVMDSVRVEPPTTRAVADLVEAPMARDIVVSVRHTGRPASGYEVREILVDPASVTAVGKMAVVQALTNLQTEEINLEGVRADAVRSAALQLPAGVEVRGGIDRVRVTVKVRELPRPAP
jgi:YbbR domain-containing protein